MLTSHNRGNVLTPKYKKPPVVETVIGVQFPEIPDFRAAHFGLYWSEIKDRFPKVDDHGRLPPVIESFPRRLSQPELQFHVVEAATPARVWFTATSAAELIQVQPDRFLFNGRAMEGDDYPSYDANGKRFIREFTVFRKFCAKHGLEEPHPNLCEVSYVNQVFPAAGESAIELFGKVFTGLVWEHSDSFLPLPEAATFNRVYTMSPGLGRLYAEASMAIRPTDKIEFVNLKLTARVKHRGDVVGVENSLQVAHDWVVRGFASLTPMSIQRDRWGRIQ